MFPPGHSSVDGRPEVSFVLVELVILLGETKIVFRKGGVWCSGSAQFFIPYQNIIEFGTGRPVWVGLVRCPGSRSRSGLAVSGVAASDICQQVTRNRPSKWGVKGVKSRGTSLVIVQTFESVRKHEERSWSVCVWRAILICLFNGSCL